MRESVHDCERDVRVVMPRSYYQLMFCKQGLLVKEERLDFVSWVESYGRTELSNQPKRSLCAATLHGSALSHTYSLLKDSWMLFSRMLYFDGIRGRSEFYAQAFLTPRNRQYRNGHSQEN